MEQLKIRMLGDFSFRAGDTVVSDASSRTRKVWLLLACLVISRGQTIPQKKLTELLWGEDLNCTDPSNTLRTTFHRARTTLNALWPNAGHELLLRRENGFAWNEEVPVELDSERFEELCTTQDSDPQVLPRLLEALDLYRGAFLERLSSEPWIIPIQTHFHNLYISAVLRAVDLLAGEERHEEAALLCRKAVAMEPYHEPLFQRMIRELAAMGKQKAAVRVYEDLSRRLFDDFGIQPSQETRQIYREAVNALNDLSLPIDTVLEELQEPAPIPGAMRCDYDHFKVLCFAESRALERSGTPTHVALLSVSSDDAEPLSRRSINRIMDQLGESIRLNTRRGDIFSQCSISQYILMLPGANYENSCMVCRRILGAHSRRYNTGKVRLNYLVQPLTPAIRVP